MPAIVQVSADPDDWSEEDQVKIAEKFFERFDKDALNPHPELNYEGR